MGGQKSVLLLYPHQLFALEQLPQVDDVLLVEEPLLFGLDPDHRQWLHKQKLIFMRASMRRYAEEILWPAGLNVEYVELDVLTEPVDILHRVRKYDRVLLFDPCNDLLTNRLLTARRQLGESAPALEFLASPNFYLKEQEVREYFAARHQHAFDEFYQWQRERFNILIEDYKPVGGAWSLKPEAKSLPKALPSFAAYGDNQWVHEATSYAQHHFADNPGSDDCIWPTSHQEAAAWLQDFVQHRLDHFSVANDRFTSDAPWLYHSALSSSLNSGLLSPQQAVDAALRRHAEQPVPLPSLELFVRVVLGQREFVRGIALLGGSGLRTANPLKANRRLTADWYQGSTGIPVFDDLVKKLLARGYAHHSERLLIAGTLMTLCEIRPEDIQRWFNELFVDAQDWALLPHVYSLGQFADDTTLVGGPYICTSKTLIDKSDYERGEWCNVWDGLYWRFVEKHRSVLKTSSRMRSVVQRLDRLDPDQRRIMSYRAEDFLNKFTG